jgi:hypothetical protein
MKSMQSALQNSLKMREAAKGLFLNNVIRSCEAWENLKVGDTVHLINPFGYGHDIQHMVKIKSVVVTKIFRKNENGSKHNGFSYDFVSDHSRNSFECSEYFDDIVQSGCKLVTHSKEEAEKELKMVHAGKYSRFVKAHHDVCDMHK